MDTEPEGRSKMGWLKNRVPDRAQALAEFALILPVLLLTIFMLIELARLLHAWLAVENAARFGLRYAVTGRYDDDHYSLTECDDFYSDYGFSCSSGEDDKFENAARILSSGEAAESGSVGILRDTSLDVFSDWDVPGFYKVTVCSESATSYTPPDLDDFSNDWSAQCDPIDHAGLPGDQIWVVVDFNHRLVLPFLSEWWPYLHLSARRDGIVERFRVSRTIGSGAFPTPPPGNSATPTASNTPTDTPTPTLTFTPSQTSTPTHTPTITPTPDCSVMSISAISVSGDDVSVSVTNNNGTAVFLT
ncbi:MAG: TadE family protein, partial [Anaerolineales bacterium]